MSLICENYMLKLNHNHLCLPLSLNYTHWRKLLERGEDAGNDSLCLLDNFLIILTNIEKEREHL